MVDLEELWSLVRLIPHGRCSSYGALGRALRYPTSGRMVGRWMVHCPDDIPWWRVVNKQGGLALFKRDPYLGMDQRERLLSENVPFVEERVDMESCYWEPV